MFQIDRTKSAAANLIALLNTGSTYAFTGSEYTIGVPSAQTPVDNTENTNSQVTLTAVDGSGFTGTKTVRYRRLAMGATKPGAKVAYTIGGTDTMQTIKTAIAVEHNLVESDFDITGVIPAQGDPAATFAVTAIDGSVLYTGTFNVTVQFPA
jgi:hypothetical protein